MNKLLTIMLVAQLCGVSIIFIVAVSDPDWIQIDAKSRNLSVHSYLPSGVNGSYPKKKLWLKVIYNEESLDKIFDHNKEYIGAYSHTFLRVTVDCAKNRYAPVEEYNESTKGYLLSSSEFPEPRQFTKIFPQTAEDTWKNFACSNTKGVRRMIALKTLVKNIYQ